MADFNVEVLKLISDDEIDDKHRMQARIVSWNKAKPVFELRPMHMKDGEWRHGQHLIKLKFDQLEQIIDSAVLVTALEEFKKL